MAVANEEQRAYWNREEARHWVDEQRRYDEMLEPFGAALLELASIRRGERVLDIGCGVGSTTRAAARAAVDGSVLGVDLSEAMLARARELALEQGIRNVAFEVDDAQTRRFAPEFDVAISRFGVMFFEDPVSAFTNIRSALRDDGRAVFVVWQELFANEWMSVPCVAMLEHVEPPAPEPGAPGPFSLADQDRVRTIFDAAGLRELSIEPCSAPMLMGGRGTLDDAVAFLRNTGITQVLLGDQPEEVQRRAIDSVRAALEPHMTDEGVKLHGAAWLVSARR